MTAAKMANGYQMAREHERAIKPTAGLGHFEARQRENRYSQLIRLLNAVTDSDYEHTEAA